MLRFMGSHKSEVTDRLTHTHSQGVAPRVEQEVMSTGKERIDPGQAFFFSGNGKAGVFTMQIISC